MPIQFLCFLYLLTGYLLAFDIYYTALRRGNPYTMFETGLIILCLVFFWAPVCILSIYVIGILDLIQLLTTKKK